MILLNDKPIGYFRNELDKFNMSAKIGADIAPKYRGNGYASTAYPMFIKLLRNKGYKRIWLEVLSTNTRAISLYRKLGFIEEARIKEFTNRDNKAMDSIVMSLPEDTCVKVIVAYPGDRRRPPQTPEETVKMWKHNIEIENQVNPGLKMDLAIILNKPFPDDKVSQPNQAAICMEMIRGIKTTMHANKVMVFDRENIGVSFGAYDYAFQKLKDNYEYFLFIEDDHTIIKDNYYAIAKQQLDNDANLGYVALVEIKQQKRHKPSFVAGGVGFTTKRVLQQVVNEHGCLPHYAKRADIERGGYVKQKGAGEYEFTGTMWRMGYKFEYLNLKECCVCWKSTNVRSDVMTSA